MSEDQVRDKCEQDSSRQSGFGKTIQDSAAGDRQPWSCLNPPLHPRILPQNHTDHFPSLTFQLVIQISATDKDVTPPNTKFKFALKTEDSNFTLINNHGEQQSGQLALRRSEVSVKSLKALRSKTRPTRGDRSPRGLSSHGLFCTTLTVYIIQLVVLWSKPPGQASWSMGHSL